MVLDTWYWMPGAGGLVLESWNWWPGSGSERPLRKSGMLLRLRVHRGVCQVFEGV